MTETTQLTQSTVADGTRSAQLALGARLLAQEAPSTQRHVVSTADVAARELARWAGRFPTMRQERIVPLCLSVAAAASFASAEVVASTARLSLWVFTVDDLFDEGDLPETELIRRAERYQQVASGQLAASPGDELEVALGEVLEDLAHYPLFAPLDTVWAEALAGTIDGMIREYAWRSDFTSAPDGPLPSYDEYVEAGLYSIGAPPHMWAAVITANDQSAPEHVRFLGRMVRRAAIAIRLANDLRSYEREMAEGNINSLVILGRQSSDDDPARSHENAVAGVRQSIAACLEELDRLEANVQTASGRPEAAIAGIARFVCGFYGRYDYHTFAQEAV